MTFPHETSVEVVNSVARYLSLSKVKKLILKVVAFTLSSKQLEELRADYFSIDTDRSGSISLEELRNALVRKNVAQDEIDSIFKTISDSGSGDSEINYSDFLAAAMLKRISIDEDRLRRAFEMLDVEGSGLVDVASLRDSLGADQSDELIGDVLKELDSNGDGKVDYREFIKYWKNLERSEKLSPLKRFSISVKLTMAKIDKSIAMFRKE